MFGLISKRKLISTFAKELAYKQRRADHWYYIRNNQEMSSYVLEHIEGIRNLALKLGITKEIYDMAYKIYDFRNSGKKDYKPNLNELSKL